MSNVEREGRLNLGTPELGIFSRQSALPRHPRSRSRVVNHSISSLYGGRAYFVLYLGNVRETLDRNKTRTVASADII